MYERNLGILFIRYISDAEKYVEVSLSKKGMDFENHMKTMWEKKRISNILMWVWGVILFLSRKKSSVTKICELAFKLKWTDKEKYVLTYIISTCLSK